MKRIILPLFFLACFIYARGQVIFYEPMSERLTGYSMDVELDPETKTVSGSMEAYWVNNSRKWVPDIQMHMYLNAFSSNRSTFYNENHGSPGSSEIDYGWITINNIINHKGTDLKRHMEYIQPDDGNPYDKTVLRIILAEPVAPGDTALLYIDFTSKLPSNIRRTGFTDDFFFVAQWFPKFGVYETKGMRNVEKDGWNCHQFHANSEFYANHSVYKVRIKVPGEYIVGSGGQLISEEINDEGFKILNYRAEDIVDFAWTAWPGYKEYEDQWEHVKIRFLSPPGREDQVDRQFTAVKNALEYLNEHVGPFPWPHLTFVDPPAKGAGAGGMEYTTIFTSASAPRMPEFINMPDMVTVHEFGHSYFMGMLATNEFEEPWMDEGINSYWESRIMDHYYGPGKGIINHKYFWLSDKESQRMGYVYSSNRTVSDNSPYAWQYPHGSYGMLSYQKATTWLLTMQGIVGEETMDEIFRTYYKEWAFKHPSAKDFIKITNRVVTRMHGDKYGENMNWFFDQTLYGTGIVDYKLAGISNHKERSFRGMVNTDTAGMILRKDDMAGDTLYTSVVRVERLGEVKLPVEIKILFEDGTELTEYWHGKSRYIDYEYSGPNKIIRAVIDPDYKIPMDVDYINNSYTIKPDTVPQKRIIRKLLTFMQFLTHIISL
ncbi:MAG: M1 family metallopeptidase [Bacteroidales bacterium]|nr:M1 family metallopeptidase [Bacteroidales bacterium]